MMMLTTTVEPTVENSILASHWMQGRPDDGERDSSSSDGALEDPQPVVEGEKSRGGDVPAKPLQAPKPPVVSPPEGNR